MNEQTFWNGERCEARIVRVIVADDPNFRAYWARPYVGQEREAVEVVYQGRTFYLDNEAHTPGSGEAAVLRQFGREPVAYPAGGGWGKVTMGRGGPRSEHRSLTIERVVPTYRRWRPDGWPYCPRCDEDELYSLATPATVETICGCYRCGPWPMT